MATVKLLPTVLTTRDAYTYSHHTRTHHERAARPPAAMNPPNTTPAPSLHEVKVARQVQPQNTQTCYYVGGNTSSEFSQADFPASLSGADNGISYSDGTFTCSLVYSKPYPSDTSLLPKYYATSFATFGPAGPVQTGKVTVIGPSIPMSSAVSGSSSAVHTDVVAGSVVGGILALVLLIGALLGFALRKRKAFERVSTQ